MELFVKVLVCLTVVLWDCVYANPAGPVITCNAPPVSEGETASVTCNFNTSVAVIRPAHFAVDFYEQDSGSPVEIAECRKLHTDNLECTTKRPGEVFRTTEEPDELVLEIAEAKKSHAGRYVCKLSAQDVNDPLLKPCSLLVNASNTPSAETIDSGTGRETLTEKGDTPSTSLEEVTVSSADSSGQQDIIIIAASAGGAAILVILLVCLVVFLIRKRRKRAQNLGAKRENGEDQEKHQTLQESPKSTPPPPPRPVSAVLNTVREESDVPDESSSPLLDTEENTNEEGEREKKKNFQRPRAMSLTEEVGVVAAETQKGVRRKMSDGVFPWDGSVEKLNRKADD